VVLTTVVDMFVFHVWTGACGCYVLQCWQIILEVLAETPETLSWHHQSLLARRCHYHISPLLWS